MLVCLNGTSKQLVDETRTPLPSRQGPLACDYEYRRNRASNCSCCTRPWMSFDRLRRQRVEVTERRARAEWAGVVGGW